MVACCVFSTGSKRSKGRSILTMDKDSATGDAQISHDEKGRPPTQSPESKSELDVSAGLRPGSDAPDIYHNPLKVRRIGLFRP